MPSHRYFIRVAQEIAKASKDPSTKVGALIVGPNGEIRSTGYNGFARKIKETETRWSRPEKYLWVVHAEHNAALQIGRAGADGCLLYISNSYLPCAQCASVIVQVGIKVVIGPNQDFPGKGEQWKQSLELAKTILAEGGVEVLPIPMEEAIYD